MLNLTFRLNNRTFTLKLHELTVFLLFLLLLPYVVASEGFPVQPHRNSSLDMRIEGAPVQPQRNNKFEIRSEGVPIQPQMNNSIAMRAVDVEPTWNSSGFKVEYLTVTAVLE
ncbi:hypothetical protein BJ508DRAFT_322892 [Ascobolus immersus RN42]|uniref:Uncharacterized protein n=1 Tax=Ascobolus immersus RN42 TaxID=1160509 RepID=A0A3N4IFY8_ASCIM|nr:hypothetical protein BJ508DRAFT_322892 [Ascobolus immersus RN42]